MRDIRTLVGVLLGIGIPLLIAAAAVQPSNNTSPQPKIEQAKHKLFSRGDAVRVTKGVAACNTDEEMYSVIRMAQRNDFEAFQKMVRSGACRLLEPEEELHVEKTAFSDN